MTATGGGEGRATSAAPSSAIRPGKSPLPRGPSSGNGLCSHCKADGSFFALMDYLVHDGVAAVASAGTVGAAASVGGGGPSQGRVPAKQSSLPSSDPPVSAFAGRSQATASRVGLNEPPHRPGGEPPPRPTRRSPPPPPHHAAAPSLPTAPTGDDGGDVAACSTPRASTAAFVCGRRVEVAAIDRVE